VCALKIYLAVHLQLEFVSFHTLMTLTIKSSHSMKFRVVVLEIWLLQGVPLVYNESNFVLWNGGFHHACHE
jgi:hypothetical protein